MKALGDLSPLIKEPRICRGRRVVVVMMMLTVMFAMTMSEIIIADVMLSHARCNSVSWSLLYAQDGL